MVTSATVCLAPLLPQECRSDRPPGVVHRGPVRLPPPVRQLLVRRRFHALQQTWHEARLRLGQQMWTAGLDDGSLGVQIAGLEANIRRAKAARGSTQALEAARMALLVRLADLALEDDAPLPGAEAEYRSAREAQAVLREASHD